MYILFSSTPKVIVDYFKSKDIKYILVDKSDIKVKQFWKKVKKVSKLIELGIIYNFGAIIPSEIIKSFNFVNIHFSLLPKYRGAVPVEATILNGDTKTGITIHETTDDLDAGDIFLQKVYGVPQGVNSCQLWDFLESKLPGVLDEFLSVDISVWPKFPQTGEVSYTYKSMLVKENALLDFYNSTAYEIVRRVKAFYPEPIAWAEVDFLGDVRKLNIYDASLPNFHDLRLANLKPGQLLWYKKHGLVVGTLLGPVLLNEISLEGKKHLKDVQVLSLKGKIRAFI